nr:MAG TPA: hypothetical protein [Caudoviricetes sp.]
MPYLCRIFLNFVFKIYTKTNKKSPKIGAF